MSDTTHTFTVTITGCTPEQAQQVIAERISYDEDYGFNYMIAYEKARPCPPADGIRLDAESVKAEAHERLQAGLDNEITQKQVEAIQNTDNASISIAINNLVEDDFWAAYDDTRSRVISHLIGMNEV